ncbi:MAG: hypothetical protein AAAFM81_01900 [Pseudomonadota bacterium]
MNAVVISEVMFHHLVTAHIVTGSVGLLTLWVPIFARKGAKLHKWWGKVFAYALLATGTIAVGISICTLIAPLETHPAFDDAALIRAIFGWMMLYLAVLTMNLSWYGLQCIRNRRDHARNRHPVILIAQLLTFLAAANCFAQGIVVGWYLLSGMAIVGLAAAVLNTHFVLSESPPPQEWLIQHSRGLVGAGISVYTAFLAFGAVNYLPSAAFNPVLWATPTVVGISYLLYHQIRITRSRSLLANRVMR